MFIPIVIPTSIRTQLKWFIDMANVQFFGGYLVMLVALLPPFVAAWLSAAAVGSFFGFLNDQWIFVAFFFGLYLFIWDRWLKFRHETYINLFYAPIEYISYMAIGLALVLIYA